MKVLRFASLVFVVCTAVARAADEFFDRVQDVLTSSAFHEQVRARLSGTIDLEGYDFQLPAPAFINASDSPLFNPRLTLFLDAQLGEHVYVFAQSRVDRGFDPSDEHMQIRLDEYAVRFRPWRNGRINFQIGKFATVVGNWTSRHGSWSNPFVNAPLLYENLTGVWDSEAARTSGTLLQWSHLKPGLPASIVDVEKYIRIPIIWGPSYASGIAVSGQLGEFRYAFELKHASLSSRPEAWDRTNGHWTYPTVSGRVAFRPNATWNVGVSASAGSYLQPFASAALPSARGLGDYRELMVGQDVTFAWHHVQIWTEIYAARFEVPNVGNADTLAYYAEVKYKFTPQMFGAMRWNQQLFGTIPDRNVAARWGRNMSRVDLAGGYRFTSHTQIKFQYSLQRGDDSSRDYSRTLSTQFTLRF